MPLFARTLRPGVAAASCATILLLAAAAGCNYSKEEPLAENYAGLWAGTTSTGGEVRFQVADNRIFYFLLEHVTPDCTKQLQPASTDGFRIEEDSTYRMDQNVEGMYLIEGVFVSAAESRGRYEFQGLPGGGSKCSRNGSGTFVVTKRY